MVVLSDPIEIIWQKAKNKKKKKRKKNTDKTVVAKTALQM